MEVYLQDFRDFSHEKFNILCFLKGVCVYA